MNKSIAEQHATSCVHFRGIQHETCEAGVDWRAITGGDDFGIATRIPCLKKNASTIVCEHCRFPTPEESLAYEREIEAHLERSREDMALIGAGHEGEPGISRFYVCELCERSDRFTERTPEAMAAHVTLAHGIAEGDVRAATGRMSAHLDARDWFQTDDRFTLPDGRALLIRSVRQPRRGVDRALWNDATNGRGTRRKRAR